jgi:hypothetical protein
MPKAVLIKLNNNNNNEIKMFNKPLMMMWRFCETWPALLHAPDVVFAFAQTDAAL